MNNINHFNIEFGPKIGSTENTLCIVNGEELSEPDVEITDVTPGHVVQIYESAFIVPQNATRMCTFKKDGEIFMFFLSDNGPIDNYGWSVKRDGSWIEFE